MIRELDVMHLGRDRVIAAHEVDGVLIDPGPESSLANLLAQLEDEPRAVLLTHIHLDHAGGTGTLVRRFPRLRVYVHEAGAAHLVDPSRLLRSAARLYGDQMERLWGEVAPVPSENVAVVTTADEIEGFRVTHTPGHAEHHVCYLHAQTGEAFVGDMAGVRIPPAAVTIPPTPPPDIDVEAWERSLDVIGDWAPTRLRLTHFGAAERPPAQLDQVRQALRDYAALARTGDRSAFLSALERRLADRADPQTAERLRQAVPPEQSWLGLERYWRKREEASNGSAGTLRRGQ